MSDYEVLKTKPWNDYGNEMPPRYKTFPTMMTREEFRLLSYLTEKFPLIDGEICDLGCFLGGSTIALAYGLNQANRQKYTIHSYDQFSIDQKSLWKFRYSKGMPYYESTNSEPLFRTVTNEFKDLISIYNGDILSSDWIARDIALLFIDISKSMKINDHIVKSFFPHLQKGSLVVQQDYLFFRSPWLVWTMEQLKSKIHLCAAAQDNSVVFYVNEPLNSDDIKMCMSKKTTAGKLVEAIRNVRVNFTEQRHLTMLSHMEKSVEYSPRAKNSWEFTYSPGIKIRMGFDV